MPGGGDDRACGHRRLRRGLVSNQMNTSEVKHDIKEGKQRRNSIGEKERRDIRRIAAALDNFCRSVVRLDVN